MVVVICSDISSARWQMLRLQFFLGKNLPLRSAENLLALLRDETVEQADVLHSVFLLVLSLYAVLGKTVHYNTRRNDKEYE